MKKLKAYIIGSINQADEIKEYAKKISNKYKVIDYVKPEKDKSFEECVRHCFDNIDVTNIVIAITKEDGSIGQGVTYELEYARRMRKEIMIINLHDKK